MREVPVLDDAEVERLADMGELVGVIEDTLRAKADGRLQAPARIVAPAGAGDLIFTVGGLAQDADGGGGLGGFRAYGLFQPPVSSDHLTAVWNTRTGRLLGVFISEALGALRTGAIGGAAVKTMARPDAKTLGLVGAGTQARTQLMGAAAARGLRAVKVFSRDPARREAFAARMSTELGLDVRPVASGEEAVADSDVVLLATNSREPVLRPSWLKKGAHINTVGLKVKGAGELPVEVAEAAGLILTDSPAQNLASGERHFLHGSDAFGRIGDLAEVVSGRAPGRGSDDQLTLFLSTGLAGTEVTVGAHLLGQRR